MNGRNHDEYITYTHDSVSCTSTISGSHTQRGEGAMIPQGYNLSFRQLSGCIRPGRGVGVLISAPDLDLGSLLSQSAMLLLVQYARHFSFPTPCASHLFFIFWHNLSCMPLLNPLLANSAGTFTTTAHHSRALRFISFYFTYCVAGMRGVLSFVGFSDNIRACAACGRFGAFCLARWDTSSRPLRTHTIA